MNNWLFLRGEYDNNNIQNHKDRTDMWMQLFREIAGEDIYSIWFRGFPLLYEDVKYVFARGGHPYYIPVLRKYRQAYKIYYGAGKRYLPDDKIKYNLILVDTEKQKQKVLKKFPGSNVHTWLKPAARHFKPMPEVKKKYDVCYVANCHSKFQEKIKRVKWVYKTAPKDLKILHLGKSSIKPPKNIKVKQVTLKEMPKYINQCKAMIVPYKNYDSEPRVIVESLACNVRPFAFESVNTGWMAYNRFNKTNIWEYIKNWIEDDVEPSHLSITIEQSSTHIRKLIGG